MYTYVLLFLTEKIPPLVGLIPVSFHTDIDKMACTTLVS